MKGEGARLVRMTRSEGGVGGGETDCDGAGCDMLTRENKTRGRRKSWPEGQLFFLYFWAWVMWLLP